MEKLKISFYTTCMGRLKHVKRTLPKNIEENKDYDNCEFVILDYNSPDGLANWIVDNFKEHLAEARVAPTPATQKKLTRPLDRSAGAALKRSLNLSVDGLDDLAWKLEYQEICSSLLAWLGRPCVTKRLSA